MHVGISEDACTILVCTKLVRVHVERHRNSLATTGVNNSSPAAHSSRYSIADAERPRALCTGAFGPNKSRPNSGITPRRLRNPKMSPATSPTKVAGVICSASPLVCMKNARTCRCPKVISRPAQSLAIWWHIGHEIGPAPSWRDNLTVAPATVPYLIH